MLGIGLITNTVTILLGTFFGVLIGDRLRASTRQIVTDVLGLITMVIAVQSVMSIADASFIAEVGSSATLLVILGGLLIGGIIGSLLQLEERLESLGSVLQNKLSQGGPSGERQRFIEGFVASSLLFSIGPLAILGPINEALGNGSEQLFLKSTLDGFASMAFAASFGIAVAFSIIPVTIIQGSFFILGLVVGDVIPDAYIAAITAAGGLMLAGVSLRLLEIRKIQVANLLPGLLLTPLLVYVVHLIIG